MRSGDRVRHVKLGPGVVKRLVGERVQVHFELLGAAAPVFPEDLELATSPGEAPPPAAPLPPLPRPAASRAAPPPRDVRRLTVECLRQGLPPPGGLASWTFGQRQARHELDQALARAARGSGSVLVFRAGYGQGKSHFARLGRELALEQGLATLHLELDGDGLSLRRSAPTLARLFANLTLPGQGDDRDHLVPGLGTLLRRAPLHEQHCRRAPLLEPFLPLTAGAEAWLDSEDAVEAVERYLAGDLNTETTRYLLGQILDRAPPLQPLKLNFGRRDQRQRAQVLQLVRVVELARLAGARGALVVLDELDHDLRLAREVERVHAVLELLAEATRAHPIVLVLGIADDAGQLGLTLEDATELALDDFDQDAARELVLKAIDAYAAAFPSPALQRGRDALAAALWDLFQDEFQEQSWGPRFFVRAAIEACEAARQAGSLARALAGR